MSNNDNKEANGKHNSLIFIRGVAKYFMDFLETDFHKRRYPKRSIKLRNNDNLLIGLVLSKYPSFYKLVWKAIQNSFSKNAIQDIKKGEHKANIPKNLVDLIKLQTNKITKKTLSNIIVKVSDKIENNAVFYKDEFDKALNSSFDESATIISHNLVVPFVNNLIKPLENLKIGDEGIIYLMEEELTEVLLKFLHDKIIEVLKTLLSGQELNIVKELNKSFRLIDVKSAIIEFFENFQANDIFFEIYEMYRNCGILDKQEFYFNFCDIVYRKIKFPIFYIPFTVHTDQESLSVRFDSQVFINKKALEYIVQEYNIEKGTRGSLKTITERIIYLSQDTDNFLLYIQSVLDEIVNFFGLDSRINLNSSEEQISKSLFVNISNSCYFSLFDKSDEALVNDYEEILEKISEGDHVLSNTFNKLIEDFINTNPISVNRGIEDEWDAADTSEKLIYRTPIPLNSEQRQILAAIDKKDSRFVTAEGPPGTGKSHTITAMVCNAILRGQAVLVLSDKKEALDVVESKITETMNNVRVDKHFQNPILRLGKAGNTYSQILSSSSVKNIKNHYRAVRQNKDNLESNINKYINTLKENIEAEILYYGKIKLNEIHELMKYEEVYCEDNLIFNFQEFYLYDKNPKEIIEELRASLMELNRQFEEAQDINNMFGTLGVSINDFDTTDHFVEFLKEAQALTKISNKLREFYQQNITIINGFNEFSKITFEKLEQFVLEFEQLRNPIFGFLFKRKEVLSLDNHFKKSFPYACFEVPHKSIKDFRKILNIFTYADELKREANPLILEKIDYNKVIYLLLSETNFSKKIDDLKELLDLVENIISFCSKFPKSSKKCGLELNNFITIFDNALIRLNYSDLASQLRYILLKTKIHKCFNNIPNFDYVGQLNNLEELMTTKMTHVMDERLINFYEENRATARSLREIIRRKQKFPRREFEKLKEAFPVILAGIRDYSDYIPLES